MYKVFLIFVCTFRTWGALFSQNSTIEVDEKVQDIGVVENFNNIQSQFIIKNNSLKNLYILRADAGRGVLVRINRKIIPSGDTSMLYVNIELKNVGKLNEEVKIVTSADADPFVLRVIADVKSIKYNDKTACFYFNDPINKKKSGKQGAVNIQFPLKEDATDETNEEEKEENAGAEDPGGMESLEMDRDLYKQNNITFLMDVSYSMKDSMNLPLAKEAIHNLIDALRDIDTVSLITYSDSVRMVKEAIRGDQKSTLNNSVSGLIARGPTMGAKAILFSLDVVLKHYMEDGNNQLFLVTDGRFKFTDEHYNLWQEKSAGKNITLTIIALGNSKSAITQLQEMAVNRGGHFIRIQSHDEAKLKVLEEVKMQSIKSGAFNSNDREQLIQIQE